jgi:hypothetical protein
MRVEVVGQHIWMAQQSLRVEPAVEEMVVERLRQRLMQHLVPRTLAAAVVEEGIVKHPR